MLKPYQSEDILELGIDECGRGPLLGRVYIAGVILPNNIEELCEEEGIVIRDSKKMTKAGKELAREFIERVAIDYSVVYKENDEIDEKNILRATLEGMHIVVNKLCIKPEKILVDGDKFRIYRDERGELIPHECVIGGDNIYMSIAAASILAKTYHDEYILQLVKDNPELEKYDIGNNMGYGTAKHLDAIREHGITKFHRRTFGICKGF